MFGKKQWPLNTGGLYKGFAKFCHSGVVKASPGKFVPDLQAFNLMFKSQFHALNTKF